MQAYQWIGAGRDSDHNLATLCSHWLDRRNEVPSSALRDKDGIEDPNLLQPPPARCPTNWQVRSASDTEKELFHMQVFGFKINIITEISNISMLCSGKRALR